VNVELDHFPVFVCVALLLSVLLILKLVIHPMLSLSSSSSSGSIIF